MSNREARNQIPGVIFDQLFKRMQKSKLWTIKCRLDDSYPLKKIPNFSFILEEEGIFMCKVVADSLEKAKEIILEQLPVEEFLENGNE
jgi:hypothetical protein